MTQKKQVLQGLQVLFLLFNCQTPEQLIQQATDKILKGRTSFLIAHRLSTIRNADLILVVKDGKIIEQGRHLELLEKKGYYYQLVRRQFTEEESQKLLV